MYQQTSVNKNRSGALDVLRFLAVLTVFFSHYTDTFNYVYQIVPANLKYLPIFKYGSIALMLFFMVSGYVITMTSINKNIWDFVVVRLSRIYPLFWISCLVAFILPRVINEHTYITHSSLKTLLVNLTMVPVLFDTVMINPVFHTLLLELVFYLFIGIVIIFKLWNRMLLIIGLLTIFCLFKGLDSSAYHHTFIIPFVAGILFYYLKSKKSNALQVKVLLFFNFISAIMVSRVLVRYLQNGVNDLQTLNVWITAAIISLIYLLFYLIVIDKIKIKSTTITVILGEIAYPFYLFHIYFLFIYWYFRDTIQADILLFGILFLVITCSWILNVVVEKPFVRICTQQFYNVLKFLRRTS